MRYYSSSGMSNSNNLCCYDEAANVRCSLKYEAYERRDEQTTKLPCWLRKQFQYSMDGDIICYQAGI
jgi:hypothetical protein